MDAYSEVVVDRFQMANYRYVSGSVYVLSNRKAFYDSDARRKIVTRADISLPGQLHLSGEFARWNDLNINGSITLNGRIYDVRTYRITNRQHRPDTPA